MSNYVPDGDKQKPIERDWEDYEYFVWVKDHAELWISIFDYTNECIFVGEPNKLINKYDENQRRYTT